jgi:hypothetical protein
MENQQGTMSKSTCDSSCPSHHFTHDDLKKLALDRCYDIFNDYSGDEVSKLPSSVQGAWQVGRDLVAQTGGDEIGLEMTRTKSHDIVIEREPLKEEMDNIRKTEKLMREAIADLEWFQTEWSTRDSLRMRINRVDWTIDNIKEFLKRLHLNVTCDQRGKNLNRGAKHARTNDDLPRKDDALVREIYGKRL